MEKLTRAERRRLEKQKKKDEKIYTLTATQLEQLEETIRKREFERAKKELDFKTKQVANDIYRMMLVIPTNVLIADHWQKSAKKRIPNFIQQCMNLYDAIMDGTVKFSEAIKMTEEYGNIHLADNGGICETLAEKVGEK